MPRCPPGKRALEYIGNFTEAVCVRKKLLLHTLKVFDNAIGDLSRIITGVFNPTYIITFMRCKVEDLSACNQHKMHVWPPSKRVVENKVRFSGAVCNIGILLMPHSQKARTTVNPTELCKSHANTESMLDMLLSKHLRRFGNITPNGECFSGYMGMCGNVRIELHLYNFWFSRSTCKAIHTKTGVLENLATLALQVLRSVPYTASEIQRRCCLGALPRTIQSESLRFVRKHPQRLTNQHPKGTATEIAYAAMQATHMNSHHTNPQETCIRLPTKMTKATTVQVVIVATWCCRKRQMATWTECVHRAILPQERNSTAYAVLAKNLRCHTFHGQYKTWQKSRHVNRH